MPRAGGAYNYLGAAYGRRWAFLFGWAMTAVVVSGAAAAVALIFVIFLNDLLGSTLPPWSLRVLPAVVLGIGIVLNLASVRASGRIATALTAVKVGLVLGIGVGAFVLSDGSWGHFAGGGAAGTCEGVPASARLGVAGFGAAVIGALWSYSGWQYLVSLAGEVKAPSRTLPRALAGALGLIVVLYMLINAAYFYVLAPEEVASVSAVSSVAGEVAVRFLGAGAASIMAAGLLLSSFGTLYALVLAAARFPFALARDGLLPAWLARVTPDDFPMPYIQHKAASERALFAMHRETGFPVTTIRPPFVHGPRQPFYREQFFWDRMLDGRPIILPDGGDAPMQWVFAPDVAEACVRTLEVPEAAGEAFNVGHVEPTTQRTFVEALARAAGVEPTLVAIPRSTIHAAGGQPMGETLYFGEGLTVDAVVFEDETHTSVVPAMVSRTLRVLYPPPD